MGLLTQTKKTLPSDWYFSDEQYQKEISQIWRSEWICIGHSSSFKEQGDYRLINLSGQSLIVVRNDSFNAFYNSCRHRGASLCQNGSGHFKNGRIICPYHSWTYDLDGHLVNTPGRLPCADFEHSDFPLYPVAIELWRGFIFLNLQPKPRHTLLAQLGSETEYVTRWPLEDLVCIQNKTYQIACNWKVFWENYLECYHCPRIHPELCRIMPVYKEAVFDERDLPNWSPEEPDDDGRGRVKPGLSTWTHDGQSNLESFQDLNEQERRLGVVFMTAMPGMYLSAHPDYVRSVRILPLGPESMQLDVDWLIAPKQSIDEEELKTTFALSELVLEQDQRVCEINQQGLRNSPHKLGVLVPQEYEIWDFHQWLRHRLDGE